MTAFPAHVIERAVDAADAGFVYDLETLRHMFTRVDALPATYLYPIKTNPLPEFIHAALEHGFGLDLCSEGDLEVSIDAGARLSECSFTSAHLTARLAQRLIAADVNVDLDSAHQAHAWVSAGGDDAGVRLCTADSSSAYGAKFGVQEDALATIADTLSRRGARLLGLHVHDAHAGFTFAGMAERLIKVLARLDGDLLTSFEYVNLGGGWPSGPIEDAHAAIRQIDSRLRTRGFTGELIVEPGEAIIGPAGWLHARVSAIKQHPLVSEGRVAIMDTATPVPCRPTKGPFMVLRDGAEVESVSCGPVDLYGSANTGLDSIALGASLPELRPDDVVVIANQGAYVRQLIGSFNERPLPGAMVIGAADR